MIKINGGGYFEGCDEECKHLVIYPALESPEQAGDVLNRLAWYLSPADRSRLSLTIPAAASLLPNHRQELPFPIPLYEEDYLSKSSILASCTWVSPEEGERSLSGADLVLIWKDAETWTKELAKSVILDPNFHEDVDAVNSASLFYSLYGTESRRISRSADLERFLNFRVRYEDVDEACLFLTGPSLESALKQAIPRHAVKIICNSIVKNEIYLECIDPDILVFADAAYHYGVSKYSAEFRQHVAKTLQRYPRCVCIIPEKFAPLLRANLPASISERVIGMPEREDGEVNFPSPERFFVKPTQNILTHLMLPLASALARTIHISGADGRQKADAGYWQHTPSAQFGDLLHTIYDTHPSFKKRNVELYYEEHCRVLENMLALGEKDGMHVYTSDTPSYIPALARRLRK